jgi:hemerythrin-like domain-containing protein
MVYMTKLLEQAFAQLRELPEDFQDKAARQLIQYVDEISTGEHLSVEEGRRAYHRGESNTAQTMAA